MVTFINIVKLNSFEYKSYKTSILDGGTLLIVPANYFYESDYMYKNYNVISKGLPQNIRKQYPKSWKSSKWDNLMYIIRDVDFIVAVDK